MKTLKYILIAVAAVLALSSCEKKNPTLQGIRTEPMKIPYGLKTRVAAFPEPWNCTDYEFTYSSSNPDVATVDEFGTLTPEFMGTTTITVTSGSFTASVPVEVYTDIPEEIWSYQIGDMIKDKFSDKLTGLWEFKIKTPMKATVGDDLIPHYPDGKGDIGPVSNDGYTTVLGFHNFDGAILTKYSANFELNHHFTATIPGAYACYTILIDAMRPQGSDNQYTTFFSYDPTNGSDQYIYWRKDGIFQFGGSGYRSGNEYFSNDKWFRIVMVKDWLGGIMKVFANGEPIFYKTDLTTADAAGFFPNDKVLLNGDNDGDDAPLYFSTVAVWDKVLTDDEIKTLGAPILYE